MARFCTECGKEIAGGVAFCTDCGAPASSGAVEQAVGAPVRGYGRACLRSHPRQGYNVLSAIILAISWRLYFLITIIGLVGIVFLVLAIVGIINAVNGRMKLLPIIGGIKVLK